MRGSKCTSFQLTLEDKLSQVMSTWVTRLDWHYIRIISTGQASIIMEYTAQIDKMGETSLKYCPPNLNRCLFMPMMWIIRFCQVFKRKISVTVALHWKRETLCWSYTKRHWLSLNPKKNSNTPVWNSTREVLPVPASMGNLVFNMILNVQFICVATDGLGKIQAWAGLQILAYHLKLLVVKTQDVLDLHLKDRPFFISCHPYGWRAVAYLLYQVTNYENQRSFFSFQVLMNVVTTMEDVASFAC